MVNCSSLTHFIFKLLHNYHFVSLFELFHLFFQTKNICLRFESFVAWFFWYFYIFISFIFYCCTKCCNILIVDNLKSYKTADVVLPIILIIQNNYRLQTMIHSTNSFFFFLLSACCTHCPYYIRNYLDDVVSSCL